jgi:hypothetical protein
LALPPRLHRQEQENTQGNVAKQVSVQIFPEAGIPTIPDLMPEVPLKIAR